MNNSAKRRKKKAMEKRYRQVVHPTPPPPRLQAHVGVCSRCRRTGLLSDEGICTGIRSQDVVGQPFEPRSKRCDEIFDRIFERENRPALTAP